MKNSHFFIPCLMIVCTVLAFSCRKKDFTESQTSIEKQLASKDLSESITLDGGCVRDYDDGTGYDSILRPTILGYHLQNNPYSLGNMQQAYDNLYASASGVAVTNKYVRFKPNNPVQLSTLVDLDVDLFDYPLDYEIVQEGDYYDDGVTPAEEIPWLYSVVGINFTPPSGITYEVLEEIHVPVLGAVENEAFRLTGNPFDDYNCDTLGFTQNNPFDFECAPGYRWNPDLMRCIPDDPIPPPSPAPTRQPSGTITVQDNTLNSFRGVRNVRVLAKRFLKLERTYTNNLGQFNLYKEFNKCRIYAQFENDQAIIRGLRSARLWQMLYPVERDFGEFRGSLNNQTLTIFRDGNARSRLDRYWAAATAHNNVQEYYEYAIANNIGTRPNRLRILINDYRSASGSAPMYAKRVIQELPEDFLRYFVFITHSPFFSLAPYVYVLKQEVDITMGYNGFTPQSNTDVTRNAFDFSETMFHELTHAAHYNKVGNAWWNDFVDAELNNIIWHGGQNPPYGNGDQGAVSNIISVGESWAYHMGHFMADLKYGVSSGCTSEQADINGNPLTQFCPNGTNQPQIDVLEFYNPNLIDDPDRWLPKGLFIDMIDATNESRGAGAAINDVVSGYSNQQFFNALHNDIRSMQQFRDRLLLQTGFSQQMINLFNEYNIN